MANTNPVIDRVAMTLGSSLGQAFQSKPMQGYLYDAVEVGLKSATDMARKSFDARILFEDIETVNIAPEGFVIYSDFRDAVRRQLASVMDSDLLDRMIDSACDHAPFQPIPVSAIVKFESLFRVFVG